MNAYTFHSEIFWKYGKLHLDMSEKWNVRDPSFLFWFISEGEKKILHKQIYLFCVLTLHVHVLISAALQAGRKEKKRKEIVPFLKLNKLDIVSIEVTKTDGIITSEELFMVMVWCCLSIIDIRHMPPDVTNHMVVPTYFFALQQKVPRDTVIYASGKIATNVLIRKQTVLMPLDLNALKRYSL